MKLSLNLFFCLLLLLTTSSSFAQSYGLAFASHDVVQDKRSGVDLSHEKNICLDNSFELDFDLSFAQGSSAYFGYIFRLIDQENRNIDFIYDERFQEHTHFKLIIGGKVSDIVFDIDINELCKKWFKFRFVFDKERQELVLHVNGNTFKQALKFKANCYKLFFGANDSYKEFRVTDVPPMRIKDIEILEKNKKLLYQWDLDEREGNKASENVKGLDGIVTNPIWIREQHHDWKLLKKWEIPGAVSVAMNSITEELYAVGEDSLYTLNISSGRIMSLKYESGKQHLLSGNQSLFVPEQGKLLNFYVDQKLVSNYSFIDKSWNKNYVYPDDITNYWHPNKFFSPADSSLYIIGGYGQFKYKKEVNRYHLSQDTWTVENTSGDFMPRYLAALGVVEGGAYILGGYGSASGEQILNPKNTYDLIFFNTKDKTFKKVLDLDTKNEEFAFANSMIIDEKSREYYALIFPNHKYNSALQLIRGSLDSPNYIFLGDKIPYTFYDIHSFSDLYYCPSSKSFVAVTLYYNDKTKKTQVSVYTLSGPPEPTINKSLVLGSPPSEIIYYLLAFTLLILVVYFVWWKKKKTKSSDSVIFREEPEKSIVEEKNVYEGIPDTIMPLRNNSGRLDKKNAIYLFGDFQLFDKEGEDITKNFTPLIKELLLVVLLYTIKTGRGISTEKLTEILWFDKSVESARNNRSVNIAKLKTLLEKFDNCQISKETGYWKINDQDLNIDYRRYIAIVNNKKSIDKDTVNELTEIVSRGSFLSNVEYDWLDDFKSEISNEVVDTYLHYLSTLEISDDPEFIVSLTNCVFYFDHVNEDAMVLKCKALSHLGKHSLAKSIFENFSKEYKSIYGEEFHKSFHEILE